MCDSPHKTDESALTNQVNNIASTCTDIQDEFIASEKRCEQLIDALKRGRQREADAVFKALSKQLATLTSQLEAQVKLTSNSNQIQTRFEKSAEGEGDSISKACKNCRRHGCLTKTEHRRLWRFRFCCEAVQVSRNGSRCNKKVCFYHFQLFNDW